MPSYRLFFIGQSEHIVQGSVVDCSTDEEAIAAARLSCGDYHAVEVWELRRRVKLVERGD